MARGLVAVTEHKSLSLHPLLRELLIAASSEADARRACRSARRVARKLFSERRWDEALCVAEVAKDAAFATEAIGAALDDLLAAGRTSSLQRWVSAARAAGAEGGLIDYAESEALLRGDELDRCHGPRRASRWLPRREIWLRAHTSSPAAAAHLTDRSESH